MKRIVQVVAVCTFSMWTSGTVVAAGQRCAPVTGHFEATVVPAGTGHCPAGAPFCTAGRVWGGIQGNYQFVMSGAIPSATIGGTPTVLFFAGTSVVSLRSGGTATGTDTGAIDLPPGAGGFASLITFTAGGSGQIRLNGEFDATNGTTSGDYVGTFCKA
jgi:hypothetical protein